MTLDFAKLRSIFHQAVERPPSDWPALLEANCGDDAELRAGVEQLLDAHAHGGSVLDNGPLATTAAVLERPGTQIGPYKLLQQIGEGGMGVVYMAEQEQPVRRRVALKIIKPGMDSRQVIARFEAERQALSLMDHPNIAKVLDAGTTESGRPYFVMELVKGQPITQYCDEHHLTPRQRLELLLSVCQAIQHAHQKGIIHRDIKPTNILVAEYDSQPVPKVIDFGVAKATSQALTEKTMFTGFGQIVGTLEYMSPEQAKLNQLDIDTRSDIYSLGVLLYELLTGSTPFDKQRLRSAAWDEMLRIIREEEPEKPSTRLSESRSRPPGGTERAQANQGSAEPSGPTLASIAAVRGTEPARLTKLVRGELDWIVMKALEKDRNRRYETASGLAADLQRYLDDEPVQACPPSACYRLRKFARRNKGALAAASLLTVAVLIAMSGIGWAVRDRSAHEAEIVRERANRELELMREREARTAKVAGQVEAVFDEMDRLEGEQKWPQALAAARRAEAAMASGEADAVIAERVRQRLKGLELIDLLEQIRMQRATLVDGKFDNAQADRKYARTFRDYGVDIDALAVERSIDRLNRRPALAIALAAALDDWVYARRQVSEKDGAGWKRLVVVARGIDPEPLRDGVRALWGQPISTVLNDELLRLAKSIDIWRQQPATLLSLARLLLQIKHADAGIRILRNAQAAYPGDFWLNFELGLALSGQKDHEGAVRFFTAAMSLRPNSSAAHIHLGNALVEQRKPPEAIAAYQRAIQLDPSIATAYSNLAFALVQLGDPEKLPEAIAAAKKAIEINPKQANAYNNLGLALRDQEKRDDAITAFQKAIELDPNLDFAHSNLGTELARQGTFDQAIAYCRKAIEVNPKNIQAYNILGIILRDQQKLDEAIAAFQKAIEIEPKSDQSLGNLGNVLRDKGDFEEAIACYLKAVDLDSKRINPPLGNGLVRAGWGLANHPDSKRRDPKRAVSVGKQAIELAPQSNEVWQYLGWIHYRAGNWKESIEVLETSCKLQKDGTGDVGQWIVMSLAHGKLAGAENLTEEQRTHHQAEARRLYDQSAKQIATLGPGDPVTQAIRAFGVEAAEYLRVEEQPK